MWGHPMMKTLKPIAAILLGLSLASCNLGSPESTGKYDYDGTAAQLDSKEYSRLTPLQQYQVANKLSSALFKGVPARSFFKEGTITANAGTLEVSAEGQDYVGKVRRALKTPLDNRDAIALKIEGDADAQIPARYTFDTDRKPMQYPMAYMFEMPLSDEYFARWMAYKLVNTIMFSPAEEIDSASERDVQKIYEGLVSALMDNTPVRSIILTHELSQANWRRFRSPEDNTREMIEIYLGLFDRDADVPKAAIACKNWSLTSEDQQYELQQSPKVNTVPQLILDHYYVTTCEDFFNVVANHPLVIPRVTTVLIDHMFGVDYPAEKRTALARDIAAAQPTTFKEIFMAILFSKEFLLSMDRPKWFEESFFNAANRMYWRPYSAFFRDLNRTTGSGNIGGASLTLMYQPAFSLKLGRWPIVPGDVLATAYQHNGLRSAMLTRSNAKLASDPNFDPEAIPSNGWGPELIENASTMSLPDFISYMFISALGRLPTAEELSTLTQVINTARTAATASTVDCTVSSAPGGCLKYWSSTNVVNRTLVVMDYLSRLPESYFYNAVN